MAQKQRTSKPPAGLSQEQKFRLEEKRIENTRTKIHYWGSGGLIVVTAVPLAVAYPIVVALSGKETVLNLSIAVTASIALTGLAAVLGVLSHRRKAKINELEARNRDLSQGMHVLQRRLRDNGLPDTVTDADRNAVGSVE